MNLRILKDLNIDYDSRVMFVFPHPDDEAYMCAGLIKLLSSRKIRTNVVILTKGEKSTLRFGLTENDNLADIREKEFNQVMAKLKVERHGIFAWPDGGLIGSFENLEMFINSQVVEYNPTHVVTYEPCGVYGHPDHIVTTKIMQKLSKWHNFNLIYATVSDKFVVPQELLKMAAEPEKIQPLKPNVYFRLRTSLFITKLKALSLYKSQTTPDIIKKLQHLIFLRTEYYFFSKS